MEMISTGTYCQESKYASATKTFVIILQAKIRKEATKKVPPQYTRKILEKNRAVSLLLYSSTADSCQASVNTDAHIITKLGILDAAEYRPLAEEPTK